MTGHGSKLSAKKKQAIAALLRMRVEDAAETIGIKLRTLQGWLKEKEFSAASVRKRWHSAIDICKLP
jgi:hypothetical protein